jgi:predicted MPP superfamily phosphohydrolase
MSLFFVTILSVFLLIVASQFVLIPIILPQRLARATRIAISFALTLGMNMIPFLYLHADAILDERPWWHRELVIFPYTMILVTAAWSSIVVLILWLARLTLSGLWPKFDTGKRQFLTSSARMVAGTSLAVSAYGTYHETRNFEVSRIALSYSGLHRDLHGFRLVHITDIHAGPFISFDTIADIVTRANALKPDLTVLTGDYVNHNPAYIDGCLQHLNALKAPAGVFGVFGNHDYYTGISAMRQGFSKTQIPVLCDSNHHARGLEKLLNIIGVDDPLVGWATEARFRNPAKIAELVMSDQFNLLLSHRPGIFKMCKDWHVPLTLAGHTHGGQIIIPGVGERGFSLADLFLPYTHGLYESEQDPEVRMYVSRGIGTIVAPLRLFCRPEIVEITLLEG